METAFPLRDGSVSGLGGNLGFFKYEDETLSFLTIGRDQELLFADGETRNVKKHTKAFFNEKGEMLEIDL